MLSLVLRFSRLLVLSRLLSKSFTDEILVVEHSGSASAFFEKFLVLLSPTFWWVPGLVGKFFFWLLTSVTSSGLIHIFEMLYWESFYSFGILIEIHNFGGISGGFLVIDGVCTFFRQLNNLSGQLLALGLKIFIEPLEKIFFNGQLIYFFQHLCQLIFELFIIYNQVLELIRIYIKVFIAFHLNDLLFQFIILSFQRSDGLL